MAEVSVVLGTIDRRDLLVECLAAVRMAAGALPYEIVVCDGGSTDGTLELLRMQPDVLLIEHGERRGAVKAYNDCFKKATGRYVAWINDDLILAPGTLPAAVEMLESDAGLGLVGIPYTNPGSKARCLSTVPVGGKAMPYAWFGMVRKADCEWFGWFSEHFYHCAGDVWLAVQIQRMGLAVRPLEGYVARHEALPNPYRKGQPLESVVEADMRKFYELVAL